MALDPSSLTPGRAAGVNRSLGAHRSSMGLFAAAALLASCTSILGDFGDGVIPPPGSGGSMSAGSGDGGSSGDGGAAEGGGGASSAGGTGGASSSECPSGRGPAMVKVPADSGSFYCVDSTEVTVAQYAEFLGGSPDVQAQPDACKPWNASFEPKFTGSCTMVIVDPAFVPALPMVCVNWCDAYAFCAWAGKRLCGAVGGGPNAFGEASSPALSQWYRACSAAGADSFPYGDMYDPAACVGDAYDGMPGYDPFKDVRQDVGTASGCEGGYPGLFDLSGNVQEWEDACQESKNENDNCLTRGGSVEQGAPALFCNAGEARARNTARNEVGFRCCADLVMD